MAYSANSLAFDCSDYPDKELIILLDETTKNVSYSDYPINADLPDDWMIVDEGELSYEDIESYITKSDLNKLDYWMDRFLGAAYQSIDTGKDDDGVYVLVESFSERKYAVNVYEEYHDLYDQASNVEDFAQLHGYGVEGYTAHVRGGDYVYKFIDEKTD